MKSVWLAWSDGDDIGEIDGVYATEDAAKAAMACMHGAGQWVVNTDGDLFDGVGGWIVKVDVLK
jgi:hypothetical protein